MSCDLKKYQDLFRKLGYADEKGAPLLLRVQLMAAIKNEIETNNWSQAETARILGVKQPRVSEIVGLRIDKFSAELLVKYLYRLKNEVSVSITKKF